MDILLIVGSEMGNAEMVADVVKDELTAGGHHVRMVADGRVRIEELADTGVMLVVTSTTGLGEVPQNLEPLYSSLCEARPDLGHLRYGLIGMGDRNYKDTYLGGPRKVDAILSELGAQHAGERLYLDATDNRMPDADAVAWLPSWLDALT